MPGWAMAPAGAPKMWQAARRQGPRAGRQPHMQAVPAPAGAHQSTFTVLGRQFARRSLCLGGSPQSRLGYQLWRLTGPGPLGAGRGLFAGAVGGEPAGKLLRRHRPGQQVALDDVATGGGELGEDRLAFHAFGDDLEAEVVA